MNDYEEIKHRGYVRGRNCASGVALPEIGSSVRPADDTREREIDSREAQDDFMCGWAFSAEEHDRDFTPFEFTAHEFNNRDDADECWAAFDDGIAEGINDEVKARLDKHHGVSDVTTH